MAIYDKLQKEFDSCEKPLKELEGVTEEITSKAFSISLEKFRSRWYRWLGQMTRCDRDNWVELLGSSWSCWPGPILERALPEMKYPNLDMHSTKRDVYYIFRNAIAEATWVDLLRLDTIYCQEVLISRIT